MSSKTREALSEILDLIDKWRTDGVMEHWQYSQLFDVADTALAEPLRNCDVGTAEEQADRFFNFCDGYHHATGYKGCGTCPLWTSGTVGHNCELRWAQMPYEKGDVK